MKNFTLVALFWVCFSPVFAQNDLKTPYEKGNGNQTATYHETIDWYKKLDAAFNEVKLLEYGTTDSGRPLHLVVISTNKEFNPKKLREQNKRVVLVQNGIHPGEPEGIDASMMLARDYLQNKKLRQRLENTVLLIIPVYNVGGALYRNSTTRTNQLGPEEYGFRGNARNLDLNRDYIKADARNTQTFYTIFQEWQPDIFLDNHTSNGADYQHVVTLIATQANKLNPELRPYFEQQLVPALYKGMEKRKLPMVPYVNVFNRPPDSGYEGFLESPRYATGYTTLFNTMGFVLETHMLKPFDQRVKATYEFMDELLQQVHKDAAKIGEVRQKAQQATLTQQQFPLAWKLDSSRHETITFKGYEAKYKPSEISGQQRLYYDRKAPFTKQIPWYNLFKETVTVQKPLAYVVPQAWQEVIFRLQLNNVQMQKLQRDTVMQVEIYRIKDVHTVPQPYEGHYLHYNVQVEKAVEQVFYFAGDYLIYLNQPANRYLIETLEPHATDAFFAWNFYDEVLQQKEYFSPYVFEEIAAKQLKNDPKLKAEFEAAKKANPELEKNAYAQLMWLFQRSEHYEPVHKRYPVGRVMR